MRTKFRVSFLIFCLLFCIATKAQDSNICTTAAIDEIINSKYKDDEKIKNLWFKLKTKGTAVVRGSDADTRPQSVNMQSIIETVLASLLKDKSIKYAKAVIYTPSPPTPLRADANNLSTLVDKEFFEDKNRMQTITNRMISLKEYLAKDGILYSVHNAIAATNNIPGMHIYNHNVTMNYGKLLDKPIKRIQKSYTGASYIAECKDGSKVFFAIKGKQAHEEKGKQWSLYYGDPHGEKLNRFFKKVQIVYKMTADVPFEFNDQKLY